MFRIILALCLLSLNAFADSTIYSSVYLIDHGKTSDDDHLVFLDNGTVLKTKHDDQIIHELEKNKLNTKRNYEFIIDDDRYVKSLKLVSEIKKELVLGSSTAQAYVPTTVASMDVLKKYFKEAPYNPKESQCFNRAMVWSYGWWKEHSLKSMKMFIFFTRDYIRRYNFEWWFHVAPYAHVKENGKVVERMLDVKYSSRPLPVKDWSDIFMRNDATCNVITKYSEYADFPYTGNCYYYRASMYYYQPADLQMNEAWGLTKDKFNMGEVIGAYKEAFDIDL